MDYTSMTDSELIRHVKGRGASHSTDIELELVCRLERALDALDTDGGVVRARNDGIVILRDREAA